jgi:tetratricopeptide (TPR) repeat protein
MSPTVPEAFMGRRLVLVLAVAGVAAAGLLAVPRHARAIDTVIGGRAEACSKQAKANIATPDSIENCTIAIIGEGITGRALAATYVNRGTMFIAVTNYNSALKDFDDAIAIQPDMGEAYVNRGGALIGLRRYQEALDDINHGLMLNPEEPEKAYGNRALARWSLDDLQGAYDDFQKCLELKPDWAWPKEQLSHFTVKQVAKP